ncbi:Helix-turn-helix domain-containing protein [Halogranum amylolyticum]|uniref:Helix-turn-helix domain-containing protein n=1 Tax=Halogranum amylolyticum TaxID=660520 RepID=A0A1H8SH99_9EURY|nr:helix-turn-helix domain-containing protein [Halogranum amylolyticum]SEO77945.1 Helix-turn-helix domain-containing protein [Halogranum amylolyticum]
MRDLSASVVSGRSVIGEVLANAVARSSTLGVLVPAVWLVTGSHIRIDGERFDNEVRSTVFRTIVDSPGTYVAALAEETDIPRSTIRYHVRVLEREGAVFGEKIRGRHRCFPRCHDDPALTAALADEVLVDVLEAIARVEPASTSELAAELDRAPSTVSHHISRLAEDGLVDRERDGGAVLTRLADDVRRRVENRRRRWSPADLPADD